ncbi:MAG: 7-cyano-7-deazaguanine synthase QueC, partial [Nitrospirae bacterium]|nr:7-cyano-7-deazaguanine synthase QueC [Nitrospirota bacterium]
MMKKAVILLSGGIDSTTTLAIAKSKGFDIYAISFNYGQRHFVELDAAKRCAAYFNVKKHLIISFDLREIGGSALTSDIEVPKAGVGGQGSGISNKNRSPIPDPRSPIPVTYVPARNTIFLSFALSWAEVLGAEDIFIGANAVDYSGYPDCRPEFISAFEDMANLATKASVEGISRFKIRAPLINLTKGGIIKKGIELGVDYSMTWSCYDPQPATEDEKMRRLEDKLSQPLNFLASQLPNFVP